MKKFLDTRQIAISISDSEELQLLGYSDTHLKDGMIEFARHLLTQGATLVYGGDLRVGGFTATFADLAEQYRIDGVDSFPFINYFHFPAYTKLTTQDKVDYKAKQVKIVQVKPDPTLVTDSENYISSDTIEDKVILANSLTKMRHKMNIDIAARVVIGGKTLGCLGKYPGIVEEAKLALETQKPLYLIGMFGGATQKIIAAITLQKDVIDLTASFYQLPEYKNFISNYNQRIATHKIDYNRLNSLFKSLNISDLNNGLDEAENQRLFTTSHIPEAIFLVLKGLKKVLK